ncbi:MAG: acyl-CoA dehydrogenase family protein, partial [Thermoleophilaceae bacterium]
QRAAYEVAESALALRAAAGAPPEELAELDRAARDSRLGPIGGGTDEIMREIVGRQLGL